MDINSYSPKDLGISIYPNPSSGSINVQLANNSELATYKIFSVVGQEIANGKLSQTESQINLKGLANGMYTIVVSQNGKTSSSKISLQQ